MKDSVAGKDYVLVDLRRADHEVRSRPPPREIDSPSCDAVGRLPYLPRLTRQDIGRHHQRVHQPARSGAVPHGSNALYHVQSSRYTQGALVLLYVKMSQINTDASIHPIWNKRHGHTADLSSSSSSHIQRRREAEGPVRQVGSPTTLLNKVRPARHYRVLFSKGASRGGRRREASLSSGWMSTRQPSGPTLYDPDLGRANIGEVSIV